METSDGIALVALGLSATALFGQLVSSYRRRRRVIVTTSVVTHAYADGSVFLNRYFVCVAVRSIGASAGLYSITFEPIGPRPEGFGYTRPDLLPFESQPERGRIHDLFNTQRVIQDGEVVTWEFQFSTNAGPNIGRSRTIDKPYALVAIATLVDKKQVKSEPFTIFPDTTEPRQAALAE